MRQAAVPLITNKACLRVVPSSMLVLFCSLALAWFLAGVRAWAVPLSFTLDETSNLRQVQWYVLKSPRFSVYAPQTAEPLARYALGSLEQAYPHIGQLLGVQLAGQEQLSLYPGRNIVSRFEHIPVIINAATDGGGFANPVTQNIELKIATGSSRALFQHELTHRMMYEHMDLSVGPAGRAFTLAMTPTWWIEGVPEFFTESIGRLQTAGIARGMALRGSFPDWDRLHSLYDLDSLDTYLRGYVTSGRFFGYLARDPRMPDLYELHRKLLVQTVIPPFVTAEDFFFISNFGLLGSTYYKQFQDYETAFWKQRSRGLIGFDDLPSKESVFVSDRPSPVDVLAAGYVNPRFYSKTYPSAISWVPRSGKGQKETGADRSHRIPSDARGNSRSRTREFADGTGVMWTIARDRDKQGRSLSRLTRIDLTQQVSAKLEEVGGQRVEIDLPLDLATHQIQDLVIADSSASFVLLNSEGTKTLALLETQKAVYGRVDARWKILAQWSPPAAVDIQFVEPVPGIDLPCVRVLVDSDDERTGIDEICRDGSSVRSVVPQGQYVIVSGADTHHGGLLLAVGWHEFLGLVTVDHNGKSLKPVAPVKDWLSGLQPDFENGFFFVWQYLGSSYSFRRFKLADLEAAHASASKSADFQKRFVTLPPFANYVPPFEVMTNRSAAGLAPFPKRSESGAADAVTDLRPEPSTAVGPESEKSRRESSAQVSDSEAQWQPAPVSYEHWFSYPWALPAFFFGPSVGLVSVPLRDEMERYQVAVYGTYRFDTDTTDVQVSYTTRRVLERFGVDLFTRERFNGLFYVGACPQESARNCPSRQPRSGYRGYFHYLREHGVSLSGAYRFKPDSAELGMSASLSQVNPSSWLRSGAIGPQQFYLSSVGLSYSFVPFETAFYIGDDRHLGGSFLLWQSVAGMGVVENFSIGKVTDGNKRTIPNQDSVHFQDLSANLGTSLNYRKNTLSLRGNIGRTLGDDPLNLRQVFSPYRTYLLGTNSAVNRLNLPLAGSSRLFNYYPGDWMFRTTLDYRRPLFSNLNARVTVLFLQSIDVEAVVGRGGVAQGEDFKAVTTVDSASAALRLNIDVKGVKIFPALAVGQIIGEPGWSLFAELAFSDFF